MTGLAYLQFFGYYLKKTHRPVVSEGKYVGAIGDVTPVGREDHLFDFINQLARAERDTLLFFYGVVMCVGGLGFIGCLSLASTTMYIDVCPTFANIAVSVALMGLARGKYTFFGHLKWTPVSMPGYAASIVVHTRLNADTSSVPIGAG